MNGEVLPIFLNLHGHSDFRAAFELFVSLLIPNRLHE
jgi:hypothetical protein